MSTKSGTIEVHPLMINWRSKEDDFALSNIKRQMHGISKIKDRRRKTHYQGGQGELGSDLKVEP